MLEHLFLVVEFKLVFEFLFVFLKKLENLSFLPSFPVSCAAHLPKSGRAPLAPPLVHLRTRRSSARLAGGPARPN
jgi:hypothetical protein